MIKPCSKLVMETNGDHYQMQEMITDEDDGDLQKLRQQLEDTVLIETSETVLKIGLQTTRDEQR